jgi:hypothetical protein
VIADRKGNAHVKEGRQEGVHRQRQEQVSHWVPIYTACCETESFECDRTVGGSGSSKRDKPQPHWFDWKADGTAEVDRLKQCLLAFTSNFIKKLLHERSLRSAHVLLQAQRSPSVGRQGVAHVLNRNCLKLETHFIRATSRTVSESKLTMCQGSGSCAQCGPCLHTCSTCWSSPRICSPWPSGPPFHSCSTGQCLEQAPGGSRHSGRPASAESHCQ